MITDPRLLRSAVREALAASPDREYTDGLLVKSIQVVLGDAPDPRALLAAREWNQAKGFITYRYDEELELDLWRLTERGRQKEEI